MRSGIPPEVFQFSTHAELKNVIGRDLINDDNIALIELVKNGLDANAKFVSVYFVGSVSKALTDLENMQNPPRASTPTTARIVVTDTGKGMSRADIKDKWLNIAYSEKKTPSTPTRLLAGNKGVGRFACDRLGIHLNLFTWQSIDSISRIEIDWSAFENHADFAKAIQDITVKVTDANVSSIESITGIRDLTSSGTIICVSALRANWDYDKLLLLKRSLERFVDPNAVFGKEPRQIILKCVEQSVNDQTREDHLKINCSIENQIFKKLRFKTAYIECEIDEAAKTMTTELFHEGSRVYRVIEKSSSFTLLGNIRLTLHYLNPYQKAYFKRETGLNNIEFGSIFFFLNGFRIPPYGDRENDWLRLDTRKNQGHSRYLGSREVLGRIELIDDTERFRVLSNREGVAKTAAFTQLVGAKISDGWFYRSLKRLEKFVVDGLDWDSVPQDVRLQLDDARSDVLDKFRTKGEHYDESSEIKLKRIAKEIVALIDAKPAEVLELSINPLILNTLKTERQEEVRLLLDKLGRFDGKLDQSVRGAVKSLSAEFKRQGEQLQSSRKQIEQKHKEVERLKSEKNSLSLKVKQTEAVITTQEKELVFSRAAKNRSVEEVMLLHHNVGLYAETAKGFVDQVVRALSANDMEKAKKFIGKAAHSIERIASVSKFALKGNFTGTLNADKLTVDIGSFVTSYIQNVAQQSFPGLAISVQDDCNARFELLINPFDVSIILDNLLSNAARAKARKVVLVLQNPSTTELILSFSDDGHGLDKNIAPPEAAFNLGVTTTVGSGLGLYHVKHIVESSLNGKVAMRNNAGKGVCIEIWLVK